MDEKVRINLMHSEQWSEYDIENYTSNVTDAYELKSNFLGIMSHVIENIYVDLLLRFNPNMLQKII